MVGNFTEFAVHIAIDSQTRVDEESTQNEVACLLVVLHQRAVFQGQTRAHLDAHASVERAVQVSHKIVLRLDLTPMGGFIL